MKFHGTIKICVHANKNNIYVESRLFIFIYLKILKIIFFGLLMFDLELYFNYFQIIFNRYLNMDYVCIIHIRNEEKHLKGPKLYK